MLTALIIIYTLSSGIWEIYRHIFAYNCRWQYSRNFSIKTFVYQRMKIFLYSRILNAEFTFLLDFPLQWHWAILLNIPYKIEQLISSASQLPCSHRKQKWLIFISFHQRIPSRANFPSFFLKNKLFKNLSYIQNLFSEKHETNQFVQVNYYESSRGF